MMKPTFGVEFEFWHAALHEWQVDPSPEEGKQVYGFTSETGRITTHSVKLVIVKALREAGFYAQVSGSSSTKWIVDEDLSIELPYDEEDHHYYTAIEVKSPAYYFSEEALNEVSRALHLLISKFRIGCNTTCGLHVHVGNELSGFSLSHLQNFCSLVWMFEDQLSALHTIERFENGYAQRARQFSTLKTELDEDNLHYCHGVPAILETATLQKLDFFMTAPFTLSMAYKLSNLLGFDWYGISTKRTIEFRQADATLNAPRVVTWIRIVVGLLANTEHVDLYYFSELLRESVEPDFTAVDLLTALGLGEEAKRFAAGTFDEIYGSFPECNDVPDYGGPFLSSAAVVNGPPSPMRDDEAWDGWVNRSRID
jgi:hypothetical protein